MALDTHRLDEQTCKQKVPSANNIIITVVTNILLLYTISLQSKVRIWTSKTPAFPRGIKGFEISLEAVKGTGSACDTTAGKSTAVSFFWNLELT